MLCGCKAVIAKYVTHLSPTAEMAIEHMRKPVTGPTFFLGKGAVGRPNVTYRYLIRWYNTYTSPNSNIKSKSFHYNARKKKRGKNLSPRNRKSMPQHRHCPPH
jgi:hypothetical protein